MGGKQGHLFVVASREGKPEKEDVKFDRVQDCHDQGKVKKKTLKQ